MIDLIYVEQNGEKTLSCGIFGEDTTDKMLGPVPFTNGILALGKQLYDILPRQFEDIETTQMTLLAIHMRNLKRGHNDSGQSYPFKL